MLNEIQIREVFHLLFLQHLFQIADPSLFILKGGVNLRFFFGNPRYSEDMDLDVLGGSVNTLTKNGYKILADKALRRSLRTFGVQDILVNDPAKAKQTETTQRFRVRLVTDAGIALPTKVEFSRRGGDPTQAVMEVIPGELVQRYHRLGFPCQHYGGRAAFLQKIRALAGRDTPQCRDVFDLHILHLGGHGSKGFAAAELDSRILNKAIETVNLLEFDAYTGQVVEFLEPEARARFGTPEAWDSIRLEILELLADD